MAQKKDPLYLTWMGTAGVLIEDDHDGILIDPYISRPGLLSLSLIHI